LPIFSQVNNNICRKLIQFRFNFWIDLNQGILINKVVFKEGKKYLRQLHQNAEKKNHKIFWQKKVSKQKMKWNKLDDVKMHGLSEKLLLTVQWCLSIACATIQIVKISLNKKNIFCRLFQHQIDLFYGSPNLTNQRISRCEHHVYFVC